MKLNYCSNCFSSASLSSDNVDNSINAAGVFKGSTKRKLIMPLEQYAMLLFGNKSEWNNKYCDNIKSHREYYSKFYTTAQLKFFSAGKEYAIERKHKVKKRDLLNDKLRNNDTNKNSQIFEPKNNNEKVENESSMMSHVAIKVPVHNDETMLASNSFIDSSTIHDGTKKRNEQKTVILKVIQFIGQLPPSVSSDEVEHCTVSTVENSSSIEKDDNDFNAYKVDNIEEKTVQSDVDDGDGVGVEPKIDRNVKDEEVNDENKKEHNKKVKGRLYDKNYRVESPPQVIATVKQTKHHTMLIQEVAVAVAAAGDNNKIQEVKSYRVESPDTCSVDTNNNIVINQNEVLVQEICESSSSESIKNEPQPTPTIEAVPLVKVINIQELPSEKVITSSSTSSSSSAASTEESITSKIECKTGKKLNKAEEAIIEALYNPELLQRNNNRFLDVITEESCDGSDVDRQSNDNKLNDAGGSDDDNDNGDVFFDISMESAKKPPLFRKRSNIHRKQIPAEQPVLINTKIIETNTIQESCNKWETSQGDSELQAELVYLNSTSSSCTDLDERSDITDTEGEDENENETSDDTEINSMLDNLTLPPLDDFVLDPPIEFKFQQPTSVHQTLSYQQESTTEQKLPNILEEDEEQTQQCTLEISESQQRIEDVNKELHHMCTEHNEQQQHNYQKHIKSTEIVLSASLSPLKSMLDNNKFVDKTEISVDKHKTFEGRTLIYDSGLTLSSFKRTNSSDSSSDSTKSGSTTNSQCTIIRQSSIIDIVLPLSELCMTAMGKHNFRRETEETTPKYTIYKTKNSLSLNAPTIPVITEIELMYEHDDEQHQDKLPDKSITLLQVAPDISFTLPNHHDNKRWYGLQSSVIPNLLVALSPMQKQYMIKTEQYNNTSSPIADLLLDMHNKFVERRAYHETIKSTNTNGNSFTEPSHLLNIVKVPESRQLEFANKPDNFVNETQRKSKSKSVESDTVQVLTSNISANRVHFVGNNKTDDQNKSDITSLYQNKDILASGNSSGSSTSVGANDHNHNIKMNSIRNCILRDEFFKNPSVPIQLADDYVDTKQCELQNELKTLEAERQKIEEELKNIQSLKHFKNEEHLFNQRKLPLNISSNMSFNKDNTTNSTDNHFYSEQMSSDNRLSKTSSSDFNEFINSNEQLQREMHDEWQHKVLERNERKLHRILKITTVSSEYISNVDCHNGERRTSELGKYFPIENEFLSKVKERRKRLSLQSDSDLNSSTESLHHQNEELNKEQILKKSQKLTQNKENIPVHLKEFLNYYDEEIQLNEESNENSDDGGEFGKHLSFALLFGSLCVAGFYIGRYFF
ncbi:unnamed protein product [Diamesa tonsa]